MNNPILSWTTALLLCSGLTTAAAAPIVVNQGPPAYTNQTVSSLGLNLSGPVVGGDARAAATYTLLNAGTDRVPGTGDDRAVQVAPSYADASSEIQLTIIGTNTLDLRSWRELDYENGASGTWTVDPNGLSVFQTVNANLPTFFISDVNLFGRQFIGRMRIENNTDDDFIGLVFGFQTNFNNGKPDSYYYLSWKKANQVAVGSTNLGEAGFKLLRVVNTATLSVDDVRNLMWDGENGTNIQVLARLDGTNTLGWALNTDYDFTTFYETNGQIAVSIRETTTGLVRWQANVIDPVPLPPGRIGFLNHSQANVRYSGLAQSDTLTEGVFEFTARSGNPGLRGLDGTPLDGNGDGTGGDNYVSRFVIDLTQPRISGAALRSASMEVSFLDVAGMDPRTVTNSINYTLLASGGDGSFTEGNEANVSSRIGSITYATNSSVATLAFATPLADEFYQLTINTGSGIRDLAGNPLLATFQTNFLLDTTGPAVASMAPTGFVSSVVDHVDVSFDSVIQAGSFTASDVLLVGPTGVVLINNIQSLSSIAFRLTFAAQGLSGGYDLRLGPDITDLAGNAMNQDGDSTNGEVPADAFAGQFVIRLPDLAVADIVAPPSVIAGQPIQLSWTIANRGLAPVNGPWLDAIHLSSDGVFGGDQLLTSIPHAGVLEAGQSQIRTATLIVPAGLSGDRFIIVHTDSANQVNEGTAETNNVSVDNQPMQILSPDLTVTAVNGPTNAQFGQAVVVSWSVRNVGTAPAAASWSDRLYLSASSNSPAGATPLGTYASSASLLAGASYTNTQSITLPLDANSAPGAFFVVVVADFSNAQPESNDTNNHAASRAMSATFPPLPDLAVTNIAAPASGTPGQVVPISWTVTNLGTALSTAPWTEAVLLSGDGVIGGDQLLASFTISNALAPGAFIVRTQNVSIPITGASGNLRFVVVADTTQVVAESSETNNAAINAETIQVPASLTLSVALAEIVEHAANPLIAAQVVRNGSLANPLVVNLASSDTTELTAPAAVTIAAGQVAANFNLTVVRDSVVDGDQSVTITATAPGLAADSAQIIVRDSDVPRLLVAAPFSVVERSNVTATVTRERVTAQDLVVELASSNPAQLTVPSSVIIPANAASASFTVAAAEDTLLENTLSYTVTASAANHLSGSDVISILDNDAPALVVTVAPSEVSESAGALATLGTVTISDASPRPMVIALESTATNAARTPPSVTIPAGVVSATFPIAAVDDAIVDGPQTAGIRAFLTETQTGARLREGTPGTFTVLDDDGPALRVVIADHLVAEGRTPATRATVSRNTQTNVALVVNLSSSDPGEATVPAIVVIPPGARAQEFAINSVIDGITDSNQVVTLTAEAPGFIHGTDTLIVSDVDLPDLVVASVTAPTNGRTDEPFNVSFRVENRGLATATGRFLQRIFLSRDPVIGDDTLLGQAEFTGSIPVGLFFAQTLPFRLPRTPGDYWVVVSTDAAEAVSEGLEGNNTALSAAPIHVEKTYGATVQADLDVAPAGTPVPLHGQAIRTGGIDPAAFELVNIHLQVRGTRRIISALTGQDGRFTATFHPLPGEAGLYTVGADHPGVEQTPVQDQFTLLGLRVTLPESPVRVIEGSSVSGQLRVENLSDAPLSGLTVTVVSRPANLQATANLSVSTLPGSGGAVLGFGLTALDASVLQGTVRFRIASTEGALADVELPVAVEALRPALVVTPATLRAGMKRGGQTTVQCQITNTGGVPTGTMELLLPPIPWLTVASGTHLPSLPPGAGTTISLLLTPPENLVLGAHQGSLVIAGANVNTTVPFAFRSLSEATGDLKITAVDEYTYYAEGAPKVTNATVTILDATSGAVVATGLTDATGQWIVTNLVEAYYRVEARAEGHGDFRATVLLAAGQTNDMLAFLPRQTVQYLWTVVPTEIEDRTKITIETVFETVVPVPVVTIEPNVIDLAEIQGDVTQIDLKITNHGLIAANETRLNFGTHPNWQLTPLIREIGVLPARSSLTIPLTIRRLGSGGAPGAFEAANAGPCFLAAWGEWKLVCGPIVRTYTVPMLILNPGGVCPGGGGGSWFPGGGGPGGGTYIAPSVVTTPAPCDPCLFRLAEEALKCSLKFILPDAAKCIKDLYGCGTGDVSFGTAYTCFKAWYNCSKAVGEKVPPLGFLKYLECAYGILTACDGLPGLGGGGGGLMAASAGVTHPELELLRKQVARLQKLVDVELLMFGDAAWFQDEGGPASANWLGAFTARIELGSAEGANISAQERAELLSLTLPQGVTSTHVNRFVDRWNRTMDYYRAGRFNLADVPPGQSTDFLAHDVLRAALVRANTAIAEVEAEGYKDIVEAVEDAKRQLQEFIAQSNTGGGVCARVRLRIDQEAVLTRDAFNASLEIINSTAGPLDLVDVDLEVRDLSGGLATGLFGIRPPVLSGLTAVDGTGVIAPNSTGKASWILIPAPDAAPAGPTEYRVRGTLRYRQGGVLITIPLAPESITVHPSASLTIKYFHQRDVFSDDPFTDVVEPSIPFTLGVMIQNTGRGTARNVRIRSAQPQIIENEKGLLIDFEIIATEVEGQNLTPSLTANFGDIGPSDIAIGRWLLRSSLQGLFIDYRATFEHLDGLGDPRLSLIDSVNIHEMIHPVRAESAFDDGRMDFLVNDVPDLNDYPDTLHLSDGRVEPVHLVTNALVDGPPTAGDRRVQLTATMPAGWTYLRVPEPGNGQFRLAQVLRGDGSEVRFSDNVWTTDRTFLGNGRRPIRENVLHLLDYNGAGNYTLVYETLDPADLAAPGSAVASLPPDSFAQISLNWLGADETNGSGLAFFDLYVSVDDGAFLPWLQRTTLNGAVYPGELGHAYAFYSVATDRAGNREAPPISPDAQTAVTLSNTPPVLVTPGTLTVLEGDTLVVTNSAVDSDRPANLLTFSLGAGAPPGCVIDPASGRITWVTGEGNGPATNLLSVRVTDNGLPGLMAVGTVTVIVAEANVAPVLDVVTNRVIREGALLTITNRASDPDLPAQSLTFQLGPGAPAGAAIEPAGGVFTWRPTEFQGPSTNLISIIVTDHPGSTAASLSATQSFTVIVRDTLNDFLVAGGTTNLLAGESSAVPLRLISGATLTNILFQVEAPEERLANLALLPLAPELAVASIQRLETNRYHIVLQTRAGQTLQGSLDLAALQFGTRTGEHSVIVPLRISGVEGTRENGLRLGHGSGRDGRVFIIGPEPLLDAIPLPAQAQRLILYGRPGGWYGIASGGNVAGAPTWPLIADVDLIGTFEVMDVLAPIGPVAFYRAVELPVVVPGFGLTVRREGINVVLEWPADCVGCVLEQANALVPQSDWSPVSATPQVINNRYRVTIALAAANTFYRINRP